MQPLAALDVPVLNRRTIHPEPFAGLMAGRIKHRLGDHFGLANFGINLTELAPGAISALAQHHSRQDEFIYVVTGTPILLPDGREYPVYPNDDLMFAPGADGVAVLVQGRVTLLMAARRVHGKSSAAATRATHLQQRILQHGPVVALARCAWPHHRAV